MHGRAPLPPDQVDQIRRLIRLKVSKFLAVRGVPWFVRDELENNVWIKVLRRLPSYDPGRAGLSTYLNCVIESALVDLSRKHMSAKCHPAGTAVSLNALLNGDGSDTDLEGNIEPDFPQPFTDDGRQAEQVANLAMDVREAVLALPAADRNLCLKLLRQTVAEIAEEEQVSRGTIYRRIDALRGHFEDRGLEEYLG